MNDILFDILRSWKTEDGVINSNTDIMHWIEEIKRVTRVDITECSINGDSFWFYDDYNGEILNRKRSFFSIKGLRLFVDGKFIKEQPIINQPEIGYLGIICKKIDGVLHFLMQAKIEPGNVNCVQISPTIQATKSNFTRAHGGTLPAYFEYFENAKKYQIIYDQVQSEQSSRFYKKRNRNMIMMIESDIPVFPNFKWMTLGQIKRLMHINNLVNMDTRTVISGLPFSAFNLCDDEKHKAIEIFNDTALGKSIFDTSISDSIFRITGLLNDYRMFRGVHLATVPLYELSDWKIDENGITCNKKADFMVRYYDIEISGREVHSWNQPLFKAEGEATFGLITTVEDGKRKFLVKIVSDIGCFDKVEIGPSIQWEASHSHENDNDVDKLLLYKLESNEGIMIDVILSEEGGRFYHEQNRNVIIEIDNNDIDEVPNGYIWTDYATLNNLILVNNCVNIQLRNLLSLCEV